MNLIVANLLCCCRSRHSLAGNRNKAGLYISSLPYHGCCCCHIACSRSCQSLLPFATKNSKYSLVLLPYKLILMYLCSSLVDAQIITVPRSPTSHLHHEEGDIVIRTSHFAGTDDHLFGPLSLGPLLLGPHYFGHFSLEMRCPPCTRSFSPGPARYGVGSWMIMSASLTLSFLFLFFFSCVRYSTYLSLFYCCFCCSSHLFGFMNSFKFLHIAVQAMRATREEAQVKGVQVKSGLSDGAQVKGPKQKGTSKKMDCSG